MTSPPSTQPIFPLEIVSGIAEFQDHQSLTALGATCSSLRQLVRNEAESLWKALHNQRWRNGKRKRFKWPPSHRPRDGVVLVDDEGIISWREEFIRRHLLDKGLPERIARLQANVGKEGVSSIEDLIQDVADIYDSIKLLCKSLGYPGHVVALLNLITAAEAQADWQMLLSTHNEVGYEDGLMVMSNLIQPVEALLAAESPDSIYDEINGMLDALSTKDLEHFDVAEMFGGGDMGTIFLHKALATKRVDQVVLSCVIAPRVLGRIHFSRTPLEVLGDLKGYVVASMARSHEYRSMAVCLAHTLE